MESVVKRKLQQINCNFVNSISCHLTAVECCHIHFSFPLSTYYAMYCCPHSLFLSPYYLITPCVASTFIFFFLIITLLHHVLLPHSFFFFLLLTLLHHVLLPHSFLFFLIITLLHHVLLPHSIFRSPYYLTVPCVSTTFFFSFSLLPYSLIRKKKQRRFPFLGMVHR